LNINLKDYGLNDRFEQEATLYEDLFIARVTEQHRDLYKLISEQGELSASVSGKFAYEADGQLSFPVVGDSVMVDRIDGVLSVQRFESYQKLQREMSYEGLNSRQLENEKINRMFGSKAEMKRFMTSVKEKK